MSRPQRPWPWGPRWPSHVGALGPKDTDPQITGLSQRFTVAQSTNWQRLLSVRWPEPRAGLIIVSSTVVPFETQLAQTGSLGGPVLETTWHWSPAYIPFACESLVLNLRLPTGAIVTFGAVLGWSGPLGDRQLAEVVTASPAALYPAARVVAAPTDDNGKPLTLPYCLRQNRVDGRVDGVAVGAGGNAALVGVPIAGHNNVLTSAKVASTAPTILRLEAPLGTIRDVIPLSVANACVPFTYPVPLNPGAAGAGWFVTSSAAATLYVTAQGFAERVA